MLAAVAGAVSISCLIIGFLIGTRARQLAASVKMAGHALKALAMLAIPAADDGDDGADDDGDEAVEEDQSAGLGDGIDDYLSYETNTGLDDHPEMVFNPILMYQIKLAKEAQRERAKLAAIEAMEGEGGVGSEYAMANDFAVKQNALAVLISVGARVTPIRAGTDGDAVAMQERRRLLKTVDVYLSKELEVDTKSDAEHTGKKGGNRNKIKTAMDVAKETEISRHGGEGLNREFQNLRFAKESRNILRDWKARDLARKGKTAEEEDEEFASSDDDGSTKKVGITRAKNKWGALSLNRNMLALLQTEFDDTEWLGEEGDADKDVAA